jgi:Domain of unknown function DUF1829/Domain of unknown function DUF1828
VSEIAELVGKYQSWLRDRTTLRQIREWTEITTPFLDRHNDCIQLYAKKDEGGYLLTDDGYTLNDLEISGCSLNSPKRRELLQTTLNGFGVKIDGGILKVQATSDSFSLRKHNLVQAMLAVNDLFYPASPTVKSLFIEDVTQWLDLIDVRYIPRVKLPGASGFDHIFDFAVPKSHHRPERLLRAMTNPNKDSAQSFAFAWIDTRETRPENAVAYAVINDNERQVPATVTDALRAYSIRPIAWSQRDSVTETLVA